MTRRLDSDDEKARLLMRPGAPVPPPDKPSAWAQAASLCAEPLAQSLRSCAQEVPLPGQARLIARCLDRARAAGLVLPENLLLVYVVAGGINDRSIQAGETEVHPDGRVIVRLRVDVFEHELQRATYHELKHAADVHAGRAFNRVEWEHDAMVFAEQMMTSERA